MRKNYLLIATSVAILSLSFGAQSNDEDEAKDFFKSHMRQSGEDYVTSKIEQSIESRFRNVEIEITDLDGDDTRYSIFTVQPLYENLSAGRVTFFQGSIIALDDDETFNLGLGQRWLFNNNKIIAGLNVFYDNEWDVGHERMSIGGEILTSVGDIRLNSYQAITNAKTNDDGNEEKALDGMDIELALPLPYLPSTRIHAKAFEWKGEDGARDIEGDTISLRTALPFGFELEAGRTSYDNSNKQDADFVSLTFNVARFHNQQYVEQPKLISDTAYQLTDIIERRFEKVRRTNTIVKQVRKQGVITLRGI
ncbi:inverse autotransporter beta domain-containing protein [Alphaproteobacteria bacterium]|nr:inverse autotransporter beta domain-containing protein [Alphaproteobacteria bacterium]